MKWIKKLVRRAIVLSLILTIFAAAIWATTFVYVVPPIKHISSGKTVWMFKPDRLFAEKTVPFLCSADRLKGNTQHASIFSFKGLSNVVTDFRIQHSARAEILKFKYFSELHELSMQYAQSSE